MRISPLICAAWFWIPAVASAGAAVPSRLASCAWLPDGRAVAVLPTTEGLELRTTDVSYPRTLADFGGPLVTPSNSSVPRNALVAVADDKLQVYFTTEGEIHCTTTTLPVGPESNWRTVSRTLVGTLRLRPFAVPDGHQPTVLVSQHESGETGSNLFLASCPNDNLEVKEIVRAPDYVAGADALIDHRGRLHIAWSEAAPEQPVRYGIFDPNGKAQGDFLTLLDAGQQPAIAEFDDGILLSAEAVTGGLETWSIANGAVSRRENLGGRMHFRPRFARDGNGVTWLFALDAERRALYYRRLLGHDFGAENIAYGVQGRWEHNLDFSLSTRIDETKRGFAILHHEDLPEGGGPRFRFDLLPVPTLAVTDDRRVLFLDMLDVAQVDNAIQRLGAPRKYDANPLDLNGPAGSPDEAWVNYADVMFDEDRFRMWYSTNTNTFERNWSVAYAESEDGIHWIKPNLGLVDYNGSKKNNLLFPNFADPDKEPEGANSGVSLVVRDEADPDPNRRYKMVFQSSTLDGESTLYLTWSSDGIHWHLPPHRLWGKSPGKNRIIRGMTPWVEPLSSLFRDTIEPHPDYRWKMYGIDGYAGHPHMDASTGRSMGMVHGATPYDFEPYPHNPIIDPRTDPEEDQNHGGSVQVYEGVYVSLYQHWWGPDWNVDLRLATSRDGIHFTRIQPERALLPLGVPGEWDSGMLCTPNQLVEHENQLWLYYRGSVGTLSNGRALSRSNYPAAKDLREPWRIYTGLARLRRDGFTYLTVAPLRREGSQFRTAFVTDFDIKLEARVRTIPIDASGIDARTLHVNVGTLAPRFAWLKAQLIDAASGQPLAGYGFDDCDPIEEDRLDHTFTWKGTSSLDAVRPDRIQVEFLLFGTLDSPRLHSFWFE